jgi:hypothetical protein
MDNRGIKTNPERMDSEEHETSFPCMDKRRVRDNTIGMDS